MVIPIHGQIQEPLEPSAAPSWLDAINRVSTMAAGYLLCLNKLPVRW